MTPRALLTLALLMAWPLISRAQDFRVTYIERYEDGFVYLEHESRADHYYVLFQGSTPTAITTPVDAALGVDGLAEFYDTSADEQRFYRVLQVPLTEIRDTDGDGIPDLYELQRPYILNPLNPADAGEDPDGDGVSTLLEYQRGTDPAAGVLARIIESSPADGESGVAVTRETVVRFSRPLAPDTLLNFNQFKAVAAGRRIISRIELSSDRRTATLYYLENLPGSSRVKVTFDGTAVKDSLGQLVDADGDGIAGGAGVIEFDTLSVQPVTGTAIIGRVFASEPVPTLQGAVPLMNRPLEGVTVTVDGMEETLRTETDADGNFILSPCPAGRFFVHVDGRTAFDSVYPEGAYYPFVGKAWEAVPGRLDNKAGGTGEIYLPLIRAGTLQPVDAATDTVVTFPPAVLADNPALAGVMITVPANALFSDNGTRGGKVGIAPVAPDRLPEALPEGLGFPLVITIQTDGPSNFDRPVPVRFPNLPDPVTGKKLPPGAKSALWSFNHDTGRWEIQGPMTVTADGNFVETDPGVGVRQPGWHGSQPGSDGSGGGGDDDNPPPDCSTQEALSQSAVAQCAAGAAIGLIETAPGVGCAVSFAQSAVGAAVDCNIDPSGCLGTIGGQIIGGAIGCIPFGIGSVGGLAYSCLYQVGDAAQAWQDCLNGGAVVAAAAIPENVWDEQAELWGAGSALFAAMVGDRKWTEVTPEESPLWEAFFTLLQASSDPASEAGTNVSATERAALLALRLPSNLTNADAAKLLDRLDGMVRGTLTPAAAGIEAIASAAQAFEGVALDLKSRGWTTTVDAFKNSLDGPAAPPVARGVARAAARASQASEAPLFFRLVDLRTGFQRRGQLGEQGVFTGIILAPGTLYRVEYLNPRTLHTAVRLFVSATAGLRTKLPLAMFLRDPQPDMDADGLADLAEAILGTDPAKVDTDGDGLRDGGEVTGGTNPLDGLVAAAGIVATADTPGSALDVCVQGNRAVVADRTAGVAVFNVFSGLNPTLIAQVDTPGTAQAVACDGDLAAVADGTSGLAVIDLGDPANAMRLHQVALGGTASAVAARNGVAYVALGGSAVASDGVVAVVDLLVGTELTRLTGLSDADDVALADGYLYVLTGVDLRVYHDYLGGLDLMGQINVSGSPAPLESGRKLFVGGGLAYVGTFTGYHTIDVSIPTAPRLIGSPSTIQAAVHDLAHNGNRTLVAITSFAGTPSLAVGLYDTTNPSDVTRFLTSFATPGDCRAVALHQGLAYVADSAAGLQVLNYLGSDTQGAAPIVTITRAPTDVDPVAPGTQVFGGIRLAPGFQVTDDAQVRTVELLLDGLPVDSDSAYPFELSTPAPNPTATKTTATLQVRATDTGGNVGLSALLTLELRPGPPSPFVVSSSPEANGTVYDVVRLQLIFDVPLDPALLSLSGFSLSHLGADNVPGGGDDRTVDIQGLTAALGNRLLSLTLTEVLPLGSYELMVSPDVIADLAGSHAAEPFRVRFALALNPNTVLWISDSDGNWSDPTRWSTGRVPGTNDPVLIDRAGANPVITIDQDLSLPSLRSQEALAASNRKLTLYGSHASEWAGAVTLSNCTVTLTGLGAVLSAPGLTQSVDTSFLAQSGARLSLPQLASFTGPAISDKTVRATGAGSRVEMPNLTSMTGPFGRTIFFFFPALKIEALAGGVVDIGQLGPTLDGRVRIVADGAGSVVDISSLVSMFMSDILILGGLEAKNGGRIVSPGLTTLTHQNVTLTSPGSITTRQLARATNVVLTVNGGVPVFSSLAEVFTLNLTVRSNATLSLPALATYPASDASTWKTEGAGSTVSFPALTSMNGPTFLAGIPKLRIEAVAGGQLDLSRLTQSPTGRIAVSADGEGSRVDLSALTEFTGLGGPFRSSLEANNGGTIAMANLTVLNTVDLLLHSAGGVPTAQLTRYTGGQATATAVNPDFSALLDVSNAAFLARSGSVITLPGFASITISGDTTWEARGAGSRLDFSNLTSVTGPTSGRLAVQTFEGGVIDLTGLNGVTKGRWTLASDGAGSLTDLRNVSTLACTSGSICEADHDGLVRLHPGTVTASGIEFQLRATGAIELGALELGVNGLLSGTGTLTGNLTNGGEVIPGASAGAITISGDYTQTAAGKLRIELGGLTAGTQFDQLNVTGLATLNGNLTVSRISGFTQAAGQSFRVLTFGSRAGDFATTTGLAQGAVTLQLSYSATGLDLFAP